MVNDDLVKRLTAENDTLRLIAAKIMPCHYCGVDQLAKCPHGFPGCSLADDMLCGGEPMAFEIQRLRAENEALKSRVDGLLSGLHEANKRWSETFVQRDKLRSALVGLLMTDPTGARADWPEYIAARAAIDAAMKATP